MRVLSKATDGGIALDNPICCQEPCELREVCFPEDVVTRGFEFSNRAVLREREVKKHSRSCRYRKAVNTNVVFHKDVMLFL